MYKYNIHYVRIDMQGIEAPGMAKKCYGRAINKQDMITFVDYTKARFGFKVVRITKIEECG